jgi:hypothetical protein
MNRMYVWQEKLRARIGIAAMAGGFALTMVMAPQLSLAQGESRGDDQKVAARPEHGPGHGANAEFLAEALGISVEELEAASETAREAGGESDTDRETLLAAGLGITVDELEAAQDVAFESALDHAVEDGKLTEEEAAQKQAEHDLVDYIDREALLADVLGITVEELESARDEGVKLPELLEELGVDKKSVREELDVAYEAAVTQAVDEDVLSQEQAEVILNDAPPQRSGQPDGRQGQEERRGAERERRVEHDADDSGDSASSTSADNDDEESSPANADRPSRGLGPGPRQGGRR